MAEGGVSETAQVDALDEQAVEATSPASRARPVRLMSPSTPLGFPNKVFKGFRSLSSPWRATCSRLPPTAALCS